MSKVRSDRCFKLFISFLREGREKGWRSGTITWTVGVGKHPHHFTFLEVNSHQLVVLRYGTIYHGHQDMQLIYEEVPNAFGRRLFWVCPKVGCERHVTTLFRPHGGAYFLCRHCWDIGYGTQYESATDRMWRRYHEGWDILRDPSSSMKDLRKAQHLMALAEAFMPHDTARLRSRLDRLVEENARRARGPGRPSTKQTREAQRAARQAEQAGQRKRSPGRPREKRPYVRQKPFVMSERTSEMQAYCPKCRDRRDMTDEKRVTFRNGRPAVQGNCVVCKTTMARIVKRAQ